MPVTLLNHHRGFRSVAGVFDMCIRLVRGLVETKRRPLHVATVILLGGSIGEPIGVSWAMTEDGTGAPKIVEAISRKVSGRYD